MAPAVRPFAPRVGHGGSAPGSDQNPVMMTVGIPDGNSGTSRGRSFVDLVVERPQVLLEVDIPLKEPRFCEGEMFFLFSKAEIKQSVEPFRYAVVLKFLRRRPSLDHLCGFIKNKWELKAMPVVGQLRNPRNILVRITNEEDFVGIMA